MTPVTRRSAILLTATVPTALSALAAAPRWLGSEAKASSLTPSLALIHDASLAEGQAFAARAQALGTPSHALAGDAVRQARQILSHRPLAVFGISRASDQLLFADVAREAGYETLALIAHRDGCLTHATCRSEAQAFAALARAGHASWPEAFAELAAGGVPVRPDAAQKPSPSGSSFSWVLRLKA